MKLRKVSLIAVFISLYFSAAAINPDSTLATKQALDKERSTLASNKDLKFVPKVERMLKLGMWKEAQSLLSADKNPDVETRLLMAEYAILNNDFQKADSLVNVALAKRKENPKALLLKSRLETWAWSLNQAESTCRQIILLKDKPLFAEAMTQLGHIQLLQKKYNEAILTAKTIESQFPKNAAAWLLESEVLFWSQKPDLAEAALKKALELDPFDADAHFHYGYSIWRKGDASLLAKMEEQWQLALDLNPLHFQTHWHWGNGHTNKTYADYADKSDQLVINDLKVVDDFIKKHQTQSAIDQTRLLEKKYPTSVRPLVVRGSIYYMAFDMNRKQRLDSAQALFLQALAKKKNYGPAHNGLAAVIKSKRIPYLSRFDSIEKALKQLSIPNENDLKKVFTQLDYYPGETVKKWAANQLYSSSAYFPLLIKQGLHFSIPPLHTDLATALNNDYFKTSSTFDNRKWMDIRGVGSGAAGIEYVERGAYGERNVLLHEFVHLFHLKALTDDELRAIRALYFKAMSENRMLDYYSANNELEYYAQAYPAFFEQEKVNPIDFKSMCTTADLKSKDPALYSFIEKMVSKEKAALAGDKQALKSNWAQVYLNLYNEQNVATASYLDTALVFDGNYLPALLAYADFHTKNGDFTNAESFIKRAEAINANYTPLFVSIAKLIGAKSLEAANPTATISAETALYNKALSMETDPTVKVNLINSIEHFYTRNGLIADAIFTAENYIKSAPEVSTYLKDAKNDQIAYAALRRAELGYNDALETLKKQVVQNPSNYDLLGQYADALAVSKNYDAAIGCLQNAQKILNAAGKPRLDYALRIGEYYYKNGDADSAAYFIDPLIKNQKAIRGYENQTRLIRLLSFIDREETAESLFNNLPKAADNFSKADFYYTKAKIREGKGEMIEAAEEYKQAIAFNPYHFNAVFDLMKYYRAMGFDKEVNGLYGKLMDLKIKPGPVFK